MKFKEKYVIGVLLSLLSTFAIAQIVPYVCCINKFAGTPAVLIEGLDSCSKVHNNTPSTDCTVKLCEINGENCTTTVHRVGGMKIDRSPSTTHLHRTKKMVPGLH
jgi:hypothetical protein